MQIPRILYVEDDAVIRMVGLINLLKYLVEVVTAENGLDAVEKFKESSFDLVFMDVAMPKMDGLTATQEIRKLELGSGFRIPIVGITASATRAECLNAGMNDCVIKPPDYAILLRRWLPQLFVKRLA